MPRIAVALAGLSLLLASRAWAGCGGLNGETLKDCQAAESSMIQQYHQQKTAADAVLLHFVSGKKTFTITAGEAGWSFGEGYRVESACAALKRDGTFVEKHATFACKQGHADGKAVLLDDEGKKRREETYRVGERLGSKDFDSAGRTTAEIVFAKKGTLVGKKFDETGKVVMRWEYKNDKRHGEWLENGQTFRYRDGKNVP